MNLNGLTLKEKPIDPALLITGENNKEGEALDEDRHKEQSVKCFASDAEKAKYYLWLISPDCSYDEWFRCASAFKYEGGSYSDFEEWSMKSDKFDETACERTWNSAGSEDKLPVTLGTLIQYARKYHPELELPAEQNNNIEENTAPTSIH